MVLLCYVATANVPKWTNFSKWVQKFS